MTALARKLESLHEKGAIRHIDIANLLGTRPETVSRWKQGKAYPHANTEKDLLELEYIIDQLSDFYEPIEARQFLFMRQRLLGEQTPADLIKNGKIDEVVALVQRMRDGVYA
jgi:transcriptional regulator with XRE-family HTH domain